MSRKRLLHILSLYLEFRYCCVNQFGYILFIVYIRFVVFFYRLVNKVDHTPKTLVAHENKKLS